MRWKVHGRRTMYESDWVNVYLDDVELPDHSRLEHHVLEFPKGSVGAVVVNDHGQILLLRRHRFITDSWGWEVPAGWIEPGEDPESAIKREIEEETGYTVGKLRPMVDYFPLAGISPQNYRTYIATDPRFSRSDLGNETSEIAWLSSQEVAELLRSGQVSDGPSLLMLAYFVGAGG